MTKNIIIKKAKSSKDYIELKLFTRYIRIQWFTSKIHNKMIRYDRSTREIRYGRNITEKEIKADWKKLKKTNFAKLKKQFFS